ncbi:MAG: hypothetical protein ACOYXW_11175 [Actinomycetota bacterium]
MARSRGRAGPADPQAIQAARAERLAEQRHAERLVQRNPEAWGVSAEIVKLPTSRDVSLRRGAGEQVLAAKRSDAFDLLHGRGSLTDEQHRAARRLFRDWCLRAGVRDGERQVLEKIDGGRADPSAIVTDAMVDAGRRIAQALKGDRQLGVQGVGPVNARLFHALISPLVDEGQIRVWRVIVEQVTGETEAHAQGAVVRQACEALRLVYDELDEARRRRTDRRGGAAA